MANTVVLFLAKALLCFSGECHPVLVGNDTLPGNYPLTHRYMAEDDVLKYRQVGKNVYSIHRISESRVPILEKGMYNRRDVTAGCVNVSPELYKELLTVVYDDPETRLIIQ